MMSYADCMNEITADELYDRLIKYGLFAEKLPPVFDGELFLQYCKDTSRPQFDDRWYPYVCYNNMRNINIPRPIGIPTPMAHERLCKCLAENWDNIRMHFEVMTSGENIKISRIHIRKMKETDALFLMNYKNWKLDGTPDPEITLGKKYVVHADISKCFPSIYSHAIPWALVGKTNAKKNVGNKTEWYNKIDYWTQRSKNGETHGLLIGPHTSNILSEIILCRIDYELKKKYKYIRNIDDYSCFVKSKDEADQFLIDLNYELKKYDLAVNHKKTEICELPMATVEQWVNQLESKIVTFGKFQPYVDYKEVRSLIDYSINLMEQNAGDTAILFYALKVLSGKTKDGQPKYNLSDNAKKYVIQKMVTLSLLYPYIVSWLDDYVFSPFGAEKEDVERFAKLIYDANLKKRNYEACSYSLYFAIKYDCCLGTVFVIDEVIKANDCIFSLLALLYCRKIKWRGGESILRKYANSIMVTDMNEQWIFIYECLNGNLTGNWKNMKRAGVSFIKAEYR